MSQPSLKSLNPPKLSFPRPERDETQQTTAQTQTRHRQPYYRMPRHERLADHRGFRRRDVRPQIAYFAWLSRVWAAIVLFCESVWSVMSVSAYVTGYWEITEHKKYCLGPTHNPYQQYVPGEQIYVVIEEVEAIIKQSFWPQLQTGEVPADDESTAYEYGVFGALPRRQPPSFRGQLAEVDGVQRATYFALLPIRALCAALVSASACVTPAHRRVFLKSRYDLFPMPTVEQAEQAETQDVPDPYVVGWAPGDGVYAPLDSRLIRGAEALEAARRAGWQQRI
ncbi:hypothetical protein M0805_000556 [Coniferiporia weirii]|nr:hypothetical protein M0805_000556 [Coniferiporia weirii]